MKTKDIIKSKIISEVENNLVEWFENIAILDYTDDEIFIEVGFDYNTSNFISGDRVLMIRGEYYNASEEWQTIVELPTENQAMKAIKDKNIVQKWNEQILDQEVYLLIDDVVNHVNNLITPGKMLFEVERLMEDIELDEEEEQLSAEDIADELSDMTVRVRYDGRDFWDEEILLEAWNDQH